MNSYNHLPLRQGVGIVLINKDNKVFVGKRIDNPVNYGKKSLWQMPQGGIDENETMLQAAKRELEEETGITKIELIKELNYWFEYELPKNLVKKIWKGKFRGQRQRWFVMKYLGENEEINVKTSHPEFLDWKWVEVSELANVVVDFKINLYKKIASELNSLIL